MKSVHNLLILLILLMVLSSCVPDAEPSVTVCESGYAPFGSGCCEDSNNDKICDPNGEKREALVDVVDTVESSKETESSSNGDVVSTDGLSLSSFPREFKNNLLIVTGSEGSAFEIKVVNNFLSNLIQRKMVSAKDVKVVLDIDNFDDSENYILFGVPCTNQKIKDLVTDCSTLVPTGKGLLKMYEKNGVKILVIAGDNEDVLERATTRLLEGVSGEEVLV